MFVCYEFIYLYLPNDISLPDTTAEENRKPIDKGFESPSLCSLRNNS